MPKNLFIKFFLIYLAFINLRCSQAQEKLPFLTFTSLVKIDKQIRETSGLIYFDNSFWSINDSGNSNVLFRIDTKTGDAIQSINVTNAKNFDWEELSQDENYVYIGDIGDNHGKRPEKQIYRLNKSDIKIKGIDSAKADIISFTYPQVNGQTIQYNAEAMLALNGTIHIFTKDLFESLHFTISAKPETSIAKYIDKFTTNGMVTGASIDKVSKSIVLVGYMGFGDRLLWKFSNFSGNNFFKGKVQSYSLGNITTTGQVEAVCGNENGEIFFSNERFLKVKQQLWKLDKGQLEPLKAQLRIN